MCLPWPLVVVLVLAALGPAPFTADKRSDYLQPYKFVKPLADLGDLYRQAEDAGEYEKERSTDGAATEKKSPDPAVKEGVAAAAAEDRIGLASPLPDEKPLMTTGLAAPEPLPQPTALKDGRERSKRRPSESEAAAEKRADSEPEEEAEAAAPDTKERKTPKEKKEKKEPTVAAKTKEEKATAAVAADNVKEEMTGDNMSNHNTELESRSLPPRPRPHALKYRVPPKPEDEYYYYYDEYYEDYPDYLPYPARPSSDKKAVQSKAVAKYPNFPARPQEKKRPPPPPHAAAEKPPPPPKEKSGSSRKPSSSGGGKPPKDFPVTVPRKSEKGDRKAGGNEPDIKSTLERLKTLRKKQESLPPGAPLPNPWQKFNAPPKHKQDHRYI